MNILPIIADSAEELQSIFRDLHRHPEIGFEERRTSDAVARTLESYGVDEVHRGIAGTGVVALVHGKAPGNRRIGLRADMDALPIKEASGLSYASADSGAMHACGHDGHTTMLLGAAKHLCATREFAGTAVLIFQPAEEGLGGAVGMLDDGLFERFPCDEIYGLHNYPNGAPGRFGICKGAAMAGAAFFDIEVTGKGVHAAHPDEGRDALMIAASLTTEFNTILARNVPPQETCVVSVTQLNAGSAYNIVPGTAHLAGTIRYFKPSVFEHVAARMRAICTGFETAHGCKIDLDLRRVFDVLVNDSDLSDAYLEAAADVVGHDNVFDDDAPTTGSEDFADMLRVVPGSYAGLGHSGTLPLHNPGFVLGEEILTVGASIMARIVERRLPV